MKKFIIVFCFAFAVLSVVTIQVSNAYCAEDLGDMCEVQPQAFCNWSGAVVISVEVGEGEDPEQITGSYTCSFEGFFGGNM